MPIRAPTSCGLPASLQAVGFQEMQTPQAPESGAGLPGLAPSLPEQWQAGGLALRLLHCLTRSMGRQLLALAPQGAPCWQGEDERPLPTSLARPRAQPATPSPSPTCQAAPPTCHTWANTVGLHPGCEPPSLTRAAKATLVPKSAFLFCPKHGCARAERPQPAGLPQGPKLPRCAPLHGASSMFKPDLSQVRSGCPGSLLSSPVHLEGGGPGQPLGESVCALYV